jgi:hypothetical protein
MVAPGRSEGEMAMDMHALEDHELDTAAGGIWPLGLVVLAIAAMLLEGSGTSNNQQNSQHSRPDGNGTRG